MGQETVTVFVGVVGTLLLNVALLLSISAAFSDRQLLPREGGWIVIPVFVGVAAARRVPEKGWGLPSLNDWLERFPGRFQSLSLPIRVSIVGTALWVHAVVVFVMQFEPYGSYASDAEMGKTVKVIVFPPILGVVGYFTYNKMIKSETADGET